MITKTEFESLQPGQAIINIYGQRCEVVAVETSSHSNQTSVWLKIPGYPVERFRWFDFGNDCSGIVDEEVALEVTLNNTSVRIAA